MRRRTIVFFALTSVLASAAAVSACGSSDGPAQSPGSDSGEPLDATPLDGTSSNPDVGSDTAALLEAATSEDSATSTDSASDASSLGDAATLDAGSDAAPDASGDTGVDAARDASEDAAHDATAEAGVDASPDATPDASPDASASGLGALKNVFTILLENHDYNEVVGSSNAPYINSLIAQGGLATNYNDSGSHPSLPNYLYLVSGATQYNSFGLEPDPTSSPFPIDADNLGHQLVVAHVPWRSYQESAGSPCNVTTGGTYVARHDPFLYFTDIQNGPSSLCAQTNVDYELFAADLAAGTYRYMWITPNLLSDGHDPALDPVTALKQTNTWLSVEVPKILKSDAYKNGGVLFITWDEAEGRSGDSPDQVPMIILSPRIVSAGYKSSAAYSHASYLATVETIFGLSKLGAAGTAAVMGEFFQ